MSLVGTLRIEGEVLLGPALEMVPEAKLEARYQATAEEYTFRASGCDFGALDRALETDDTVADPRVLADFGDVRVYRVRPTMERPLLSEAAGERGVQLLDTGTDGGSWRVEARFPDRSALAAFKSYCDDHGVSLRVERLYTEASLDGADEGLTDPQRAVLVTAYEMGYLEEPRGCSLADVADALDISSSAASGRLRRAVAALTERHVVRD